MSGRGRWLLLLVVGAAVIAVGAVAVRPRLTSGPVEIWGAGETSVSYVRADVGSQVVFGQAVLHNSSQHPVYLRSAQLQGKVASSDAAVVEVRAMDPKLNDGTLVGAAAWPYEQYRQRSSPLTEYVLAAGRDAELLFIVHIRNAGEWQWPQIAVVYSADGRTLTESASVGFMACAPRDSPCGQEPQKRQ